MVEFIVLKASGRVNLEIMGTRRAYRVKHVCIRCWNMKDAETKKRDTNCEADRVINLLNTSTE